MAVTFLTNEDEKKYVKTINDTAPDENGNIVVKGEGIAYDNTVSGIDATTVQGAIDKLSGGNVDLTGYATEQWVKDQKYLTAVPEGYAKDEDIPTKPEDIGAQPSGNYLTEVPSGYATEEFVKNKIAEAELGGEEVDLSGYAQKSELPTKVSQLQNDSGYLTEHQDISGKLDASALPTAINTALAQAKASGEFDGKDGVDGYTPVKGKDYVDGTPGKDGSNGVSATHSWNGTVLTVTSASGTSSADLKGAKGDSIKGDPGADGVSPTVAVSKSGKVTTVSITDKSGTKTATINDGVDGSAGKDGTSVTHSWNGTTLTVTSASGTSSADLKGAKGDNGKDGSDYVLTDADKDEIAETVKTEVPLVKTAEQPTFVNSVDEMTDKSKVYVMPDMSMWAHKKTTGKRVTPLTSEDFVACNLNTDGTVNTVSASKIRIATTEMLPLSGDLLCINCPSPYQYIVYYYSGATESTYIGKTSFKSGGTTNILTDTVTSGKIDGAKYCRISLRDSTNSNAVLTDRVDEFMSAISVEFVSAEEVETVTWANTGSNYNQPADYEDRITALEKALEGIEYGTF